MRLPPAILLVLLCLGLTALADEPPVSLFSPQQPTLGWTFSNGPEFKGGGLGGLSVQAEEGPQGSPSLLISGDFSTSGLYVAGYVETPEVEPEAIEFEWRSTMTAIAVLRVQDATGQVHQIRYELDETPEWQTVSFPIADFFARMGTTRAVTGVKQYQYWDGAKDGKWHGPIKSVGLVLSKNNVDQETMKGEIYIAAPRLVKAVVREQSTITKTLRYTDFAGMEETGWTFDNGREFKGATGDLVLAREPADAPGHLRLSGDFTAGGAYVQALKSFELPPDCTVTEVRFKVRSSDVSTYGLRLIDGGGQVHQNRNMAMTADGEWQQITITPSTFVSKDHWGGANDGKWNGAAKAIAILLNKRSDKDLTPVLEIADVELDATMTVEIAAASLAEDFEAGADVPDGWQVVGDVSIATVSAGTGKRSLRLRRTTATINDAVHATGPSFACTAGVWEFSLQSRSELESQDASFSGTVFVDFLSASGAKIASNELVSVFGSNAWAAAKQTIEAPAGSAKAQLRVSLNKATGFFWVDDLSATRVMSDAFAEKRIERVLWTTAEIGNLLYPEQPVVVNGEVESHTMLTEAECQATFTLRDYWGAEQGPTVSATLTADGRTDGGLYRYRVAVDVSDLQPELYRYYELHVVIPQKGQAAFTDYTALARLPKAETKAFKPEDVPFTSRNWDNRIPAYFYLSDRIGLRTIGLWGDWKATPPYENKAPRIELAQELGMASISRIPTTWVERRGDGWEAYTDEVLRAGVRKFLADYKPLGLTIITLGNEPRVGHERAPGNVKAYKSAYEEIKKIDPDMLVVGTSSGTEEAFFEAGFQDYLDVYDFHVYEHYSKLEKVFARYDELFEKYNCRKPIWSTELGLNSQGQTRHAVAVEMIKKCAVFFALGGENMSWFGLVYPDPTGRARGASGDSHNVFDCRYSLYSPRLDAVMYYTMVNAIGRKKFVLEKTYDHDARGFHFQSETDGNLQVWWSEGERHEIFVPLPGVTEATIVRVDSSRRTVAVSGGGLTLSVAEEPVMLLYANPTDAMAALPESLGVPALTLQGELPTAKPGSTATVTFAKRADWRGEATALVPSGWAARVASSDTSVTVSVDIPADTAATALQLRVACDGEVTVPITLSAD